MFLYFYLEETGGVFLVVLLVKGLAVKVEVVPYWGNLVCHPKGDFSNLVEGYANYSFQMGLCLTSIPPHGPLIKPFWNNE